MTANSVDVTIATRNSSKHIAKCLKAIIKSIPYRKIVVVDAGSGDGTVEVCKSFGAEVITERGYLGKVRYVQALNCKTEWIAIVDSDVYVYPEWWRKVSTYMPDREVGMVNCMSDMPISKLKIYTEFNNFFLHRWNIAFFSTLVRRNLVLQCKEKLQKTHAGEDYVVASHILSKGMKIITIRKPLCFHDKDLYTHHPLGFYRWGQTIRIKYGLGRNPHLGGFRVAGENLIKWCIFTRETKRVSFKLLFFLLYLGAWTIVGFLRGGW